MIYRFGPCELDVARAELRRDTRPQAVEPQVFSLITLLVESRDRLVTRDEIIEKVWDGRMVSDTAVSSRVKSARQAIGDDGTAQRLIKTVHGRGYRFVGEVTIGAAAQARAEASGPSLPVPAESVSSRPSIAVLPLRVLGDAGHPALADGLAHELIAGLSRLRWLLVTARGSSFRFGTSDVDVHDVGRILGVRYCLTGTTETRGRQLVATVALADTEDRRVVWADRFAGLVDDVHGFREAIIQRVLAALEIEVPLHESMRSRLAVTEDLDAWGAYHRGIQHMYRFSRVDNAAATACFERALSLDPSFARAHAGLSFVHFQTAFLRDTDALGREVALSRRHAEQGLALDPLDPFVNFTMGRSFWLEGDLDAGRGWLERATTINPNYAQGFYARGWTEALAGNGHEGLRHVDLAMQLSPLDPLYYAMLGTRAFGHFALDEDVDAAHWAERAARSPGAHVLIAMIAVVAHGLVHDDARAAFWAANVRRRNPGLARADFFRSFPLQAPRTLARIDGALAQAGF